MNTITEVFDLELYQVSSNITTKLLAHYSLNIQCFESWSISVENPGTICVQWVRDENTDEEEASRFKGEINSLITGYSLTRSAANPEELQDSIKNDTHSFASDSAMSFFEAEFFLNELLTKDEMILLQDYLVSLGCNVEVTKMEFPVTMEDAVSILSDDPNQPFEITLDNPGVGSFSVTGVVDEDVVTGNWTFPDKA
jgi:hypothetical protein